MAYTKYSLTPANNTAAPPDGAPEGMLPSAVNDTMRDMMAQIRDCGDGIRDGTYTMTAPKITGGTITGVAFTGNTFTNPVISGGSINNTPIGATTANTGAFTTLSATGVTTVQAGTNSAPAITTSGDTNTGIFFPAADTIAFTEGGVESMRITSTGTVAIGTTTTPAAKLWVESGRVGLSNTYKLGWHSNPAATDFSNYITGDDNTNYVVIGTNASERMRIDSSGRVLLGSTDTNPAVNNNPGVAINANADNNYYTGVIQASATSNAALFLNRGADDGTTASFRRSGTSVGSISVTTSSTAYNTSSDYRLKENIAPMTGALAVVGQLKPCIYTWKADGSSGQGFIAHELQTVVPDAVCGEKDAIDKDGNPEYQGVDTSFLVATLTAAIQELKAELDSVKAELQTLKGK